MSSLRTACRRRSDAGNSTQDLLTEWATFNPKPISHVEIESHVVRNCAERNHNDIVFN